MKLDIREALEQVLRDLNLRRSLYAAANSEMERLRLCDEAVPKLLAAGDLDRSSMVDDERKHIKETLSGLRKEISEPVSSISVEELRDLWQAHARAKNPVIKKKLAAYEQTRKLCLEQLLELVDIQQDELKLREDTAVAMFGLWEPERQVIDRELFRPDYISLGLNDLEMLPQRNNPTISVDGSRIYPDAAPYICSGDLTRNQFSKITRVALRQKL